MGTNTASTNLFFLLMLFKVQIDHPITVTLFNRDVIGQSVVTHTC